MTSNELFHILKDLARKASLDPGLEATVLVELGPPDPARWQGRLQAGQVLLTEGAPDCPDLTICASSETALAIFSKTLSPMMAFMTGKIKVKGDLAKIALLKNLLKKN